MVVELPVSNTSKANMSDMWPQGVRSYKDMMKRCRMFVGQASCFSSTSLEKMADKLYAVLLAENEVIQHITCPAIEL